MKVAKSFTSYVWFVLVVVFLVIVAGSVVRTTQSGMGCPDWPTCFGSAIPPTDAQQVAFQPRHLYKKGQFIIYKDSLKYAKEKFISGFAYNPAYWKQYEKHNNATFSVLHTWIEYINRLLGALLGIFVLIQFAWSIPYFRHQPAIVLLSFLLVLLTGFQAWLGKTVVDSNLALLKITIHMFGALAMVFVSLAILFQASGRHWVKAPKKIVLLTVLLGVIVLLQLLLGTQVRAEIDHIAEHFNYLNRSGWISELNFWFYIHRSFSLVVAGLSFYIFFLSRIRPNASVLAQRFIFVVILEIIVGVVLAYADFPQAAQPVHLLLSSVLIALVFNSILRLKIER
ncbi:COX15/CtaA family protein [Parasediminibacterium sp. JCM 36343]|uniref:COX15/CtaA family protein n=1 Tax=Parasediminibacterium sp. JCM 36343 TaxID=3374279 RepID=UPI0039792D2B